ncbi:hypothetical protein QBC38DRAFT_486488 [Podospora fimiseda]|uniref:Uncharacterized protein n=1 Tax=Podospora fimiseda TaxID=252190 RepID=A0AAN7BIA3_9PEZI|nr:hypothetical protein QBC38DRAFT_486488 [Podospora fimiseda]
MDNPADTCWSWPHWKFGLKKDDLFSKLHDQYNTVPTPILDPEAFHHDVYEISNEASTTDEFYRLLRDRKQQRIRELNESLESAAFEIVANPSLIGTEQWQYAVQLFRTKSLDSLVRYFSSYLPSDHPWYKTPQSSLSSGVCSSTDASEHSSGSLLDDDDGFIITDEPEELEYSSTSKISRILPPSPQSMTMCSDSSAPSPIDADPFDLNTLTPARTASYSESEPDCCTLSEHYLHIHKPEAQATGVEEGIAAATLSEEAQNDDSTDATPLAVPELDTPKPEGQTFFDKLPLSQRRHRSLSPSRPYPLSDYEVDDFVATRRDPRSGIQLSKAKRDKSPMQRRRKGPGDGMNRIQKPALDGSRLRTRGRRCFEV